VTHFRAEQKTTFACTTDQTYEVDVSLSQLEERHAGELVRIHRAILVNLAHVREVESRSAAGACVRPSNAGRTELPVARDRLAALRARLGI
jgi:two-component system response regulator AlgR